ncbi:hypothetical protein PPL_07733 [Heterostelium album PN500]|uniref:Uncharacterized protein n=1 Tax=Heterostelium pallidum (strain ATCC 26659 / Pp 5 / PN500) TaxID=670386 RepID=D3BGT1_HETP5|nr:hypothetical protein PPL_07733 [Heterostelium album PN500]EFA79315.1 hypothetical protein PPL_07733 [Heterostelium album PN500]|eukprot:XP_020431436.1 hypothetical protein PPL_07733 [Heterostelium album PN500]
MNIVKSIALMLALLFMLSIATARPCCERCPPDSEKCQANCIDCDRPTTFATVPPWPEPTSPFPAGSISTTGTKPPSSTSTSSTTGSTTR